MSQVTMERRSRTVVMSRRPTRGRPSALAKPAAVFGASSVMALAIWLGLATGLIELALLDIRWRFVDATALSSVQLNQHALWMVPFSHAMVFTCCGLAMAVMMKFTRARWVGVLSVYGLCFLSVFALLLTYRGLSSLASSALAGGIAFRLSGRVRHHGPSVRRLINFSLPFLVGLITIFWAIGP
jgi:hypothetical protein